jgi:FkbM family methyltransferase
VGSNIGLYTCFALAHTNPELAIAIEPHPRNAKTLRQNGQLNGGNLKIFDIALSDVNRTAVLKPNPPTGHILQLDDSDGINVDVMPGDQFIHQYDLPQPSIIKIDVEGTELSVLRGLESTLKSSSCRIVYCELHPHKSEESILETTAKEILNQYDFSIVEVLQSDRRVHLKAVKQHSNDNEL